MVLGVISMAAASIIAAIAALAGTVGTTMYNRAQDRKNIDEQNKYNSPEEAMKRMEEAGINPNAAAQGITGSAGFGNMQAASVQDMTPIDANSIGDILGGSANNVLQAKFVEKQMEYLESLKNNTDSETEGNNIDNFYKPDVYLHNLASISADTENKRLINDTLRPYADNAEAVYNLNMDDLRSKVSATTQQVKVLIQQEHKISADTEYTNAKIGETEANTANIQAKTANEWLDFHMGELRKKFCEDYGVTDDDPSVFYYEQGVRAAFGDKDAEKRVNAFEQGQEALSKARTAGAAKATNENDPQAGLKKLYEQQMKSKLADLDAQIKVLSEKGLHGAVKSVQRQKEKVIREYRNKMRRVDKGFAAGANFAGYGLNAGG